MAPADVLAATTLVAAELMGVDGDPGTIEAGKAADLVVVDGDPLDFTGFGDRIRAVYQVGLTRVGRHLKWMPGREAAPECVYTCSRRYRGAVHADRKVVTSGRSHHYSSGNASPGGHRDPPR